MSVLQIKTRDDGARVLMSAAGCTKSLNECGRTQLTRRCISCEIYQAIAVVLVAQNEKYIPLLSKRKYRERLNVKGINPCWLAFFFFFLRRIRDHRTATPKPEFFKFAKGKPPTGRARPSIKQSSAHIIHPSETLSSSYGRCLLLEISVTLSRKTFDG